MNSIRLIRVIAFAATVVGVTETSAEPPPSEIPKGAILAFTPDSESDDYDDLPSLRQWLRKQGWAICDGRNGTPDLHYRFLLGSESMEEAGRYVGSSKHSHRIVADTTPVHGRDRRFHSGFAYRVRVPDDGHRHRIDANSTAAEHLPLSIQVLFIIKIW